jgi:hypothetical protein
MSLDHATSYRILFEMFQGKISYTGIVRSPTCILPVSDFVINIMPKGEIFFTHWIGR